MFGKIKLQYLKTLERAPHSTLAFRSYLLMIQGTVKRNKVFYGLNINGSPLSEHRRIAEILGAADRKLELERRKKRVEIK